MELGRFTRPDDAPVATIVLAMVDIVLGTSIGYPKQSVWLSGSTRTSLGGGFISGAS